MAWNRRTSRSFYNVLGFIFIYPPIIEGVGLSSIYPIVRPWHLHTKLLSSSKNFKQILKETSSTPTWKLCTRKVSTNLPVHLRGNSSCWTPSFNAWACKKPLRKPLIRWFVEAATSKTKRKPKQRGFFFGGGVTFSGFNTLMSKPSCNTRSNKNLEILVKINMVVQITDAKFDWLAYEKGDRWPKMPNLWSWSQTGTQIMSHTLLGTNISPFQGILSRWFSLSHSEIC